MNKRAILCLVILLILLMFCACGRGNSENIFDSGKADTVYLKPVASYQDILDNVYEVIVADKAADIVEADKLFSSTGIREAKIWRGTDETLSSVGYTLYDVDGNGIEELIIADKRENIYDNRILLMYTLHNGKPVLLIDGWMRYRFYLLDDNTVYNEGSSGAAYTIFATYRMAEDGIRLEAIDCYYSDPGFNYKPDIVWHHNTTGIVTMEESEIIEFEDENTPENMMNDYRAKVKELELTFFR